MNPFNVLARAHYDEFPTLEAAQKYRRGTGIGGWIFSHEGGAILFGFGMTHTDIMLHPLTRGLSGTIA